MGRVIITADGVYQRYGKALGSLSKKKTHDLLYRSLYRGGNQTRTLVRRSLVSQTGIKYGRINEAISTEAPRSQLRYSLIAKAPETNLSLFNARQRKKGVSAAPWKKRRIFRSSFIVPRFSGRIYIRTSGERGPLRPLYGPNIAREILKEPTVSKWKMVDGFVMSRVEHELMRLFKFK